jgi:SAM-dependent methyltransferase
MRVLDVGSGGGDVALLAAGLVGSAGRIVGADRSATALAAAGAHAKEQGLANVEFREGDPAAMNFELSFDAVIGRYVLMFQADPVPMLRRLAGLVRAGGLVLFHEPDRNLMQSYPPVPAHDQLCQWLTETFRRSGADVRMGIKLYSTFLAAGLPAPTVRLHAIIGGAEAVDEIHLEADIVVTLVAEIERLGVATAGEIGHASLVDSVRQELSANRGVIVGRAEMGAWSRI